MEIKRNGAINEPPFLLLMMKSNLQRWLPLLIWGVVIFLISDDPNPYASVNDDLGRPAAPKNQEAPQVLPVLSNDALGEIGHLTEYIVLGVLTVWAVQSGRSIRFIAALALSICMLYALSDEIHQIFVPGRAFQLVDLGLDLLGSSLGTWIGLKLMPHLPGKVAA